MTNVLAEATTTIRQAVLDHLGEDELARYHDDAMDAIERRMVKAHLDRCLICSRRYEYTAELLATAWNTDLEPAEAAHNDACVLEQVLAHWQAERDAAEKAAAGTIRFLVSVRLLTRNARLAWQAGTAQTGRTEDGSLEWRIEEDEGDLNIRLGSPRLELADAVLSLQVDGVRKEAVLRRVTEAELGAKVIITRAERGDEKAGTDLVIESIEVPVRPTGDQPG